ncbi:MAG: response regulator [Desulfatirhabdiaceae bacterium]|nr:response regulator [Desulfatirhabdiaceae bacterium]
MNRTVMIVDDEGGIRVVLGIALSDMGYDVLSAETGEQALELFRSNHPSIILTDIKMPGMGGIELLQAVKRENPDVEVIMMTGHGDMDLAVRSLKYEATDFVTKPISDEALEVALKRAQDRIAIRKQIRDYTENLELLVREKTQKLIEAERLAAVGEAIAGISHSIKNIAGGLKGGAFVLEKGIELHNDQYLYQGWTMVKGNVEKIANLSMDLLNYGKSSEIHCRSCDPNQPAKEIVDLMTPLAEASGVRLDAFFSTELQSICLDPDAIHQCLNNLVANAIDACGEKSMPDSPGKVILRTLQVAGWGVEYQVEDNGCGMDEDTRRKLFQSFFSTKGSKGTGIGLMTTKKIVEKHHGDVLVKSTLGAGTLFVMRLPESSLL